MMSILDENEDEEDEDDEHGAVFLNQWFVIPLGVWANEAEKHYPHCFACLPASGDSCQNACPPSR